VAENDAPALMEIAGGIARLTFNRPHRRNAVDAAMHEALRGAMDALETRDDVAALILTGAGDAFCAGQDLAERAGQLAEGEVDLARSLEANYNPLVRRLVALPFPVIAAVNGIASGAGAALAIGCDVVLAARSARFQFGFAKVGLGPDSGTSWLLPRLIGQANALALALTADTIDAEEAQRIGLVFRVLDDAALVDEATRIAQGFATGPRVALRIIERLIRTAANLPFDAALDAERDAQGLLGHHPDYREAVTAFMAKRPPNFAGETPS
jgi:2-(1,2-epoxy-1,2-dihydrophenyl)acetyl-CoA isomerase